MLGAALDAGSGPTPREAAAADRLPCAVRRM